MIHDMRALRITLAVWNIELVEEATKHCRIIQPMPGLQSGKFHIPSRSVGHCTVTKRRAQLIQAALLGSLSTFQIGSWFSGDWTGDTDKSIEKIEGVLPSYYMWRRIGKYNDRIIEKYYSEIILFELLDEWKFNFRIIIIIIIIMVLYSRYKYYRFLGAFAKLRKLSVRMK